MIGLYIKHKRIKLNLTSIELAKKLNISIQRLNNFESETRTPPLEILNDLSIILNFDIDNINKNRKNTAIDYTLFKNSIYDYRLKHNLTLNDLSEKIGFTRQTISKWEKGLSIPNIDDFFYICETLKIKPSSLIGVKDKNIKKENKLFLLLLIPLFLILTIFLLPQKEDNINTNYPSLPEHPKEDLPIDIPIFDENNIFITKDTISFINEVTTKYNSSKQKGNNKINFNDNNIEDIFFNANEKFLLPYYFDNEKFIDHYLFNGSSYSGLVEFDLTNDIILTPVYITYEEYFNSMQFTEENGNIVISTISDTYNIFLAPKHFNKLTNIEIRNIPTHITTFISCENYLVFNGLSMNYIPEILIFNCENIEFINNKNIKDEIEILAIRQIYDYNYESEFSFVKNIHCLYIKQKTKYENFIIFNCEIKKKELC